MHGKFADLPKRIATILALAIICIPAVILRDSQPILFAIAVLAIAALSMVEAVKLYRTALYAAVTPWSSTTHRLKSNSHEAFSIVTAEYVLGVTALLLYDRSIIWLIIISACAYDVFALLTGKLLGGMFFTKRPCPILSPTKTWEGCIGGWFFSIVLSFAYLLLFTDFGLYPENLPNIALAVTGCFIAFFGDLSGSHLKRLAKVKDSGNLLPGHGGCLDRFVSLYAVAAYYLFLYLPLYLYHFA
ncbi:phosphatidate cytidylyltransferase [Candidatus Saccharibacteria bacterium]|nr:phosphatidate cytidylyltransferase [Candidatus Saccharibacteria bacterium]